MKKVYLSYHDIHTDCIKLAKIIKKKYNPKKLVIISKGGLIPGSIIAHYLEIEDINIISIRNIKEIKSLEKIIVVDDLINTGKTAEIIKKNIPNSKLVVLYNKKSIKKNCDLSLYKFNSNELIVLPWEKAN
tara:strand:+ start:1122 stop:1514 length:393 start_codon:yes stop_codon:yes gene_type:complete